MVKKLKKEDSNKVVARLESQVDLLEAELTYLNGLLIDLGFFEGIKTLKATAEELLAEGSSNTPEHLKGC